MKAWHAAACTFIKNTIWITNNKNRLHGKLYLASEQRLAYADKYKTECGVMF